MSNKMLEFIAYSNECYRFNDMKFGKTDDEEHKKKLRKNEFEGKNNFYKKQRIKRKEKENKINYFFLQDLE